jgi:hypothetical protein
MTNKQAALFGLKNYRPPRPIGVKGGCSPQNNRKTSRLLNELPVDRNKFYVKNFLESRCTEMATETE